MKRLIRKRRCGEAMSLEWIRSNVEIDERGCWLWLGAMSGPYGQTSSGRAHRVAYELAFGKLRPGLYIDHAVCQVKRCCNPGHLEAVPPRENTRRHFKHLTIDGKCGRCGSSEIRDTKARRQCLACIREHKRAYDATRKQVAA